MTYLDKVGELWARTWPAALILALTTLAWFGLSHLAFDARRQESAQVTRQPIPADYDKAKAWATDILGLAATLAGFLGVAAATKKGLSLSAPERAESAEGGMIGILAGATLLGVGNWVAPLGLVALASGAVTVRVIRTLREK